MMSTNKKVLSNSDVYSILRFGRQTARDFNNEYSILHLGLDVFGLQEVKSQSKRQGRVSGKGHGCVGRNGQGSIELAIFSLSHRVAAFREHRLRFTRDRHLLNAVVKAG
jgi:hypothetical protein